MSDDLIICTGGGTGGHVFPGLAVAEVLSEQWEGRVGWIGSAKGVEREIVASFGLPFWSIPAGKLRRYPSLANLPDMLRVLAGLVASLFLLGRLRPIALFSKGGFVSVPPAIAAWILRIPVYSHESDVDPGLATRINARCSRQVFIPYEGSRIHYPRRLQDRLVVTGNPVRRRVLQADPTAGRAFCGFTGERPIVLFAGGSRGAAQINGIVREIAPRLRRRADLVHQRGLHPAPEANASDYVSFDFLVEEFPDILAAADLVVCRAGAGTLWELAATGTPAVLIPLMFGSSRGDQVRNAQVYGEAGAAVSLIGDAATAPAVADAIESLLDDAERLRRMSEAAASFGAAEAAPLIAATLRAAAVRR
ncbi:MAG: undecaprenyldiphospho-muramoylpentapeptide beta-N-acetylglucosaminyltransferase [Spirochaetota bacterium]